MVIAGGTGILACDKKRISNNGTRNIEGKKATTMNLPSKKRGTRGV